MTININDIRLAPTKDLEFCVFGDMPENIQKWIDYNSLETYQSGPYINIKCDGFENDLNLIFDNPEYFHYLDGFSPNLNKELNLGHLANLIIAKAIYSFNIAITKIAIYGDTLADKETNDLALNRVHEYQSLFDYIPDIEYFASQMIYPSFLLTKGKDEYEGTQIFNIDGDKIVGIKSDGSTSYFCQDVALAVCLNKPTLYITGKEQNGHFQSLKRLFPHITHLGIGLVAINGLKMSSRLGNTILIKQLIEDLSDSFNNDKHLIYNVIAGHILKSSPDTAKNIVLSDITNPKTSKGLYLSYTIARLKSAGCEYIVPNKTKPLLDFLLLKSQVNLKPNILFEGIIKVCEEVNQLYNIHKIKDNESNKKMFEELLFNIIYFSNRLGFFTDIEKV